MGDVLACPFGPEPHSRGSRHKHPYQPESDAPRQCGCGSRAWEVTVPTLLPVSVVCARCGKVNRVATAYERGREKGPRVRDNAGSAPPF